MLPHHPSFGMNSARRLLLRLGAAMVAGGMPVYEVEEETQRLANTLGYPHPQCSATPTGIHLGLASGEPAAYERIHGPLRLDQLARVNDIRRDLMAGRTEAGQALAALAALPHLRPRYSAWGRALGVVAVAAGICLILQPGPVNVVVAAFGGLLVAGLAALARRVSTLAALLPTAAAFVVGVVCFSLARAGLLLGPLRTLLCSIAVLLPGGTLATALAELAAAAMIAGTARLVYGLLQMLLFALGIALAAAVTGTSWASLNSMQVVSPFPAVFILLGLVTIAAGMALSESMPVRLVPWAFALLLLTYVAQAGGQALAGPALGAFIGACVASFFSAVISLISPRVPRTVIFLPAFWLLVPGTLGLLSLTQLSNGSGGGREILTSLVGLTVSLALGLLVGSAAARPLSRIARAVARRRRAAETSTTGHPLPDRPTPPAAAPPTS